VLAIVYDNETGEGELLYANGTLVDEGFDLDTAVLLSWFLDAPAQDVPRAPDAPRGGWWGNRYTGDSQPMGSRLWLLEDALCIPATAQQGKQYAEEAAEWLVRDGHIRAMRVVGELVDDPANPAVLITGFFTLRNGQERILGPFKVAGKA
jgi:phage gp46-like protein